MEHFCGEQRTDSEFLHCSFLMVIFPSLSYSRDSDLSTIISNLHNSRQHGMPEGQSASDHGTRTGHTGKTPCCVIPML